MRLITRRSEVQILPRHHVKAQVADLGFRRCGKRVTGGVYRLPTARRADMVFSICPAGRRLPAGSGDEGGELVGGDGAHAGEYVLVGVHGEGRVSMAEAFAYDLDRHAGGYEQ